MTDQQANRLMRLSIDPAAPQFGSKPGPSTNVQWKGTDLCMDVVCACGTSSHCDGYNADYLRCPGCSRVFALPTNLWLRVLTPVDLELVDPDSIRDLEGAPHGG